MADDKISKKTDSKRRKSNAVVMPNADSDELPQQLTPSMEAFLPGADRQRKTVSSAVQQQGASESKPVAVRDTQSKPLVDAESTVSDEELKKVNYYQIKIGK